MSIMKDIIIITELKQTLHGYRTGSIGETECLVTMAKLFSELEQDYRELTK